MEISPNDGKFSQDDVADLRNELLSSGLDNWQAAELIASFLAARGYGVSTEGARYIASHLDATSLSLENMQRELEQLARHM
ncbi:hypothetical protein [Terriglobus sp. ADX1]|uniref:hypothetical protein n=1 Tax=Terriglobus sp. ADX1 TaxID=2794063 RepID=UPI002FE6592A